MSEVMKFSTRKDFRSWLQENCMSTAGIWVLFGKAGGPKTIKAGEALEEALCFGWIDTTQWCRYAAVYASYCEKLLVRVE